MEEQDELQQKAPHLVRRLGPLDATMIVVGSMIGSGIFITSAESARLTGAPGWLVLAWAVAGIMTMTGALCCAELAAMMPRAGGLYVFLREAYGPSIGFLFGWTLFLVIQTGTIAAVAIAFAKFTGVFAPAIATDNYLISPVHLPGGYAVSLSTEQLVAIAVILLLTWTNTRGLETGKLVQNVFTLAKTAALMAVIIIGLSLGWKPDAAARASDWWDSWSNGWNPQAAQPGLTAAGVLALALLFGKAMVGPLFAQTAWTNVTFIGSEVRDPGRNLARALLGGCALVVVLYVLANLAYVAVLPLSEIQHAPQNRVAVAVMNSVFGRPGALAMAAAIMISTFGCNNGLILAGARVYYAMARDGLFFKRIGTVNRRDVPAAALVAQAVWTVLLTLPRTVTTDPSSGAVRYGNVYTQLLEYIVSADLVFYILLAVAVIVLRRKRPDADRPYRMWGYPIVPIVSVGLAALLVVDLAYLAPTTSGIGYVLVLTGIPVYFLWRRSFSVDKNA
ncbi:MAG TPA: amino acid permease [Chthoniobacterales bacterium]|jgi:APA family basic amino acid/polyamine antiporter|nr:amino acid permease [Chthoniobacterales bacterium]